MAIRAVIFDIGGVLVLVPPRHVLERWEKAEGLEPGELGRKLHPVIQGGSIGTIREDEVTQAIAGITGWGIEKASAFMEDVWEEYLGEANEELMAYFNNLRSRCLTAIISNSFVGARKREQDRYQIENLTGCIIYSHEAGMNKPDSRIYHLACERLGVAPEEAVFLDDREEMVQGARVAGMHGIHYTGNAKAVEEIEELLAR